MTQHQHYSDEEVAQAWIRRFSQNRTRILLPETADAQTLADQRIELETKWAFEELEKIVKNDAPRAWAVILRILETAPHDDDVLDNLSAGPLETLLALHGRDVIEWVEAEAKSNPGFRDILQGVWGNAIDGAVWERIQALLLDSTNSQPS
jgi:hypothetical protein